MATEKHRTLAVIDIENLCGGPDNVNSFHRYIRYLYDEAATDMWMPVIATSTHTITRCPDLWWTWHDARRLHRTGPDAADLELLDTLREPTAQRCDHIEIWSGDHIFADAARRLRRHGTTVTVRAAPAALSRQLRYSATRVHELVELNMLTASPRPNTAA